MNEKIDIFILSYLRPKMTMETIKYLKERTRYPYRLFLIDNGGNEEAKIEYADDFFLTIDPSYNVGVHSGWNIALALAESDYFVTTDNDILVPDVEGIEGIEGLGELDWLGQLVKYMDERPDYGAIALQPQKFIGLEPSVYPTDGEIINTPMVGAVMRLLRRDAVWKAGGWERWVRQSRNHEEKTICSRLATAGYKFGYTSKMKAFHMFGKEGESDYWGYDKDAKPEDHGHRDVWPPPWVFGNKADYDNKTWEKLE